MSRKPPVCGACVSQAAGPGPGVHAPASLFYLPPLPASLQAVSAPGRPISRADTRPQAWRSSLMLSEPQRFWAWLEILPGGPRGRAPTMEPGGSACGLERRDRARVESTGEKKNPGHPWAVTS